MTIDEIRKLINETPFLQSSLYDLDLMPEQVAAGSMQEMYMAGVAEAYIAGQKSNDAEIAALKAQQNKLAVYATPQAALAIEPPA